MSRSTPLNNLPNKSAESSHAYDENENELVKEILQEIDTEKNPQAMQQQSMQQQAMQQQAQQQAMQQQAMQQQAMQKQVMQQQAMEQQAMEQQSLEQHAQQEKGQTDLSKHMNEQEDMHTQMLDNQTKEPVLKSQSMVEKIVSMAKLPLIVAAIAVLVSVPAFTTMLEGVIKSKASLASYGTIIILLVKGVLAGGLYFGINKSL
jgi:Fe2+ transport system protein B